jgi:prepilin-type N-terminal cleavage/methylation domain-containing protein
MFPAPARNRGFTLIELVVVIVIISVLATVALRRLTVYQELAEKTAMESTLRIIKTGLQIRLAELIIANRQSQAKQLETSNPMRWLVEPPANYGGTYRQPAEGGKWYYDERRSELVYVVNNGEFLTTDATDDGKQLRFRVELLNGYVETARAKVRTVTGITLVPVRPYRWP